MRPRLFCLTGFVELNPVAEGAFIAHAVVANAIVLFKFRVIPIASFGGS